MITTLSKMIFIIVCLFMCSILLAQEPIEIELIPDEATKRVLVPVEDIGVVWSDDMNFDDSGWSLCEGMPGGIGYERNSGYENFLSLNVENEMYNKNGSCYIRIPFNLESSDLSNILFLGLRIRYDDGFVAYLNGHKIVEVNAPQSAVWNSFSTRDHEADIVSVFDISPYISKLVIGQNLLAIHGLNRSNASSDFLISVQLTGSNNQYGDFDSSNLPLILINTNGQNIPDEPKIDAEMKIIDNGPGELNRPTDLATDYDGKIGIEIRGRFSAHFPQKPYGLETRDSLGNNLNISLLGMPEENDWVLTPMYNDKSLLRYILAFDLFRDMGHYSIRARLVEVFLNTEYRGIYVFCEKIKRDAGRVNISRLDPDENDGDELTGGYIVKIDYHNSSDSWLSNYSPVDHPERDIYFVYHYPDWDKITDQQKTYIQNFIDSLETALYSEQFNDSIQGFRRYIDENSFVDYFILSEVSRNIDGYKKSRYFYKNKNSKGGNLHAGPVWDFDWAWKNIRECYFSATDGSGWSWKTNDCNPGVACPGWYVRLLQDGEFTEKIIERYFELRKSVLDLDNIYAYIDSITTYVDEAKDRHFDLWPIELDYRTPEVDPPSYTYAQEINKLNNWITNRISWLDKNIPDLRKEVTNYIHTNPDYKIPTKTTLFYNYPNPFNPVTTFFFSLPAASKIEFAIYNSSGQLVTTLLNGYLSVGKHSLIWVATNYSSGLYFYRISNGKNIETKKCVLLK